MDLYLTRLLEAAQHMLNKDVQLPVDLQTRLLEAGIDISSLKPTNSEIENDE